MKLSLLCASQAQSVPLAVTVTVLEPPAEPKLALVEVGETLQGAAASVTVKIWLAMVIVPVKGVALVLAGTVLLTIPSPMPLLPEVIVMKPALLLVDLQNDFLSTPGLQPGAEILTDRAA